MYTISKAPHLILRAPPGVFFSAGPQLSLDATIQSPVKNVASILQRTLRGEKHFFQANEGKVIPFTVVITPLIYSWLNPTKWIFSCFRVVFTSITSTSYKSLSVLRVSFHFLHLFFWRSWHISSTKLRGGHDIRFGRSSMFICAQTALSLFTYTYMKFLSFLTQRQSFCSTNVVKMQVSSSLKDIKDFESRTGIDPGMINLQSPTLTTRPPRIRCRMLESFNSENPNPK